MATRLDAKFVPLVLSKLETFGKDAVFTVYPSAGYDPTTGKLTPGTGTPYTVKIIPPYPYEHGYRGPDVIQAGDMQTGIAASGLAFTPKPDAMTVTIDGQVYRIVSVEPIYSGEQVCLYLLQLRRG